MSVNQFGQQTEPPLATAPDQLHPAGASVRETAQEAGEQLKQKTAEAADQLKQKGSETLQQVRQQAEEMATERKHQLVDKLVHCSAASRKAAEQLRQDNDPLMARYADSLASGIERSADYVRDCDYRRVIRDTESFARRRPEIFYGSLFIAGLALARFLKASSHRQAGWNQPSSMHLEPYPLPQEDPFGSALESEGESQEPGRSTLNVASAPGNQFTG